MNILLPLAIELIRTTLAYLPNICSENGGVCEDGNINLIASHFLEHFANSVLDPLYGFANILSILINTSVSSFTGLFYENAEAPSLVDNTQNYFRYFLGLEKMLPQGEINSTVVLHIIFCYAMFIIISAKTILNCNYPKPKVDSVFDGGDKNSEYTFHGSERGDGDAEHCWCKFKRCHHDISDEDNESI